MTKKENGYFKPNNFTHPGGSFAEDPPHFSSFWVHLNITSPQHSHHPPGTKNAVSLSNSAKPDPSNETLGGSQGC